MKNLFSIATKILVASGGFIAFFSIYMSLQAAPSESMISENKNVAPKASALELTSTETPPSLGASGVPNPVCLDNYQSFPNSNTFKADAPWSTAFVGTGPHTSGASNGIVANPFERDLNGDGLLDYLYIQHSYNPTYGFNTMQDCVYLNNGSGWTLAYRCYATTVNSVPKFYGDCAEVAN